MTDKEVFEKFMGWMGMKVSKAKDIDNKVIVEYDDIDNCDVRFTKCGYDEFYAGAIFDENGKMVKGYVDSHVAYTSDNCDKINEILKD
jgi:predicted nucleic-acid-binding Zn-ribbon protein